MRQWVKTPKRSLQVRILASVLLGLGFVVVGLAALVLEITGESTRYALNERLALAEAVQRELDGEILAAQQFAQNLGAAPGVGNGRTLQRLLQLTDLLDAAVLVDADGRPLQVAGRHGVQQAWPVSIPLEPTGPRIFSVPGRAPAIGLTVRAGSRRLLVALASRARMLHRLGSHSGEAGYAAQLVGPDGAQIAVAELPAEVIGRHLALVESLSRTQTAGVVMHRVSDRRFDHYVAYAPLTTLPGWGVTVEQSRDVVAALPQRLRRLILVVGLLMLLAGGTVAWLDVRRVVTPLLALARDAERIGRGDLATPIRIRGQDELSGLAESLDRMRAALGDSLAEIQRREARARALHEVGTGILRSPDRDNALAVVVSEARRQLAGDVALLCLHDARAQQVLPVAVAGDEMVLSRTAPAHAAPGLDGCPVLSQDYRAGHLVARVSAGDALLGSLCVGTRTARTFTDEDRALLESLGTLAALALENFRLRAEIQWLGAIQERERLARELHDGLAQALGIVYAYARQGGEGTRPRALERIAEISARAYEEVRQAIYGLRLNRDTDLASAIGEYLREFTRQTGLLVNLIIEDHRATALSQEAEVQVVRIVQEALANVWRHAHATRAVVRFAVTQDEAVVSVEDDGIGFEVDRATAGRPRFGLLTMRERAESAGGALTITSARGVGTCVTARIPMVRKEVASWIRSG